MASILRRCFSLIAYLITIQACIATSNSAKLVSLDLYYESLCPYSADFIVNELPIIFVNGIIDIVDLRLFPWGNAKLSSNNSFTCQHGPAECLLNTVEACAIDAWPNLVVKAEGPTKGRKFYACPHWPRTCGFLKWADMVDDVDDLQHQLFMRDAKISELEAQNYVLRDKIRKLRIKKKDLFDEVEEMGIANTETLFEMKTNNIDRKLFFMAMFVFVVVLIFK